MTGRKILILTLAAAFTLGACAPRQAQPLSVREEYVKAHPDLAAGIKEALLQGKPVAGMTVEQVMVTSGAPEQVISQRNKIGGYDTVWNYRGYAVVFGDDSVVKEVR